MPTDTEGPYLVTAVFCDNTIEDKTGVLSIIRIIDRVEIITPSVQPPNFKVLLKTSLVVSFRSGDAKGNYDVILTIQPPDKDEQPLGKLPLLFQEPAQTANLMVNLNLGIQRSGVYWFSVYLGERFITRTPLTIVLVVSDETPAESSSEKS